MHYSKTIANYIRETIGEPKFGAEVGAWAGVTSNVFLHAFPEMQLHAIDPWEDGDPENTTARRTTKERLQEVHEEFNINTAWAKDRLIVHCMLSLDGAAAVPDGELDFVFVDGDHRYQPVKDDLNAWWPKLRDGGLLIGHDYRKDRFDRFGVVQATDEFVAERNLTMQMVNRTTCAIQKPA